MRTRIITLEVTTLQVDLIRAALSHYATCEQGNYAGHANKDEATALEAHCRQVLKLDSIRNEFLG